MEDSSDVDRSRSEGNHPRSQEGGLSFPIKSIESSTEINGMTNSNGSISPGEQHSHLPPVLHPPRKRRASCPADPLIQPPPAKKEEIGDGENKDESNDFPMELHETSNSMNLNGRGTSNGQPALPPLDLHSSDESVNTSTEQCLPLAIGPPLPTIQGGNDDVMKSTKIPPKKVQFNVSLQTKADSFARSMFNHLVGCPDGPMHALSDFYVNLSESESLTMDPIELATYRTSYQRMRRAPTPRRPPNVPLSNRNPEEGPYPNPHPERYDPRPGRQPRRLFTLNIPNSPPSLFYSNGAQPNMRLIYTASERCTLQELGQKKQEYRERYDAWAEEHSTAIAGLSQVNGCEKKKKEEEGEDEDEEQEEEKEEEEEEEEEKDGEEEDAVALESKEEKEENNGKPFETAEEKEEENVGHVENGEEDDVSSKNEKKDCVDTVTGVEGINSQSEKNEEAEEKKMEDDNQEKQKVAAESEEKGDDDVECEEIDGDDWNYEEESDEEEEVKNLVEGDEEKELLICAGVKNNPVMMMDNSLPLWSCACVNHERVSAVMKCLKCGKRFHFLMHEAIIRHIFSHCEFKRYQCEYCDYSTNHYEKVHDHFRRDHSLLGVATQATLFMATRFWILSNECFLERDLKYIDRHIYPVGCWNPSLEVAEDTLVACSVCGVYSKRADIHHHILTNHFEIPISYFCPFESCLFHSLFKSDLSLHCQFKHQRDVPSFVQRERIDWRYDSNLLINYFFPSTIVSVSTEVEEALRFVPLPVDEAPVLRFRQKDAARLFLDQCGKYELFRRAVAPEKCELCDHYGCEVFKLVEHAVEHAEKRCQQWECPLLTCHFRATYRHTVEMHQVESKHSAIEGVPPIKRVEEMPIAAVFGECFPSLRSLFEK